MGWRLDIGASCNLPVVLGRLEPYIVAADREFRGAHAGASDEYLVPRARAAFEGIGLHLTDSQLEQYALSVAEGWTFEFTVD